VEPTTAGRSDTLGAALPCAASVAEPRSALLAWLDELLSLSAGVVDESARRNLQAGRTRVAEDRFNLVVLGEFKRGKSTLINALLERDLLPVGVVPLTSVVTVIGAGDTDRLVVRYLDGREQEEPLGRLAEFVTEERNPGNRFGVELARIELDHVLLWAGLELIDTPGIGSIHQHNTDVARGFMPMVDAAVCVLDAGQPLSEGERGLLREAATRVPRLMMVINKIDHLDPDDRQVAVDFVRSALQELLGATEPELFAVSARNREGVAPLLDRLRGLAGGEREWLLLRSVAAVGRIVASETAQAARFESHAIELPLEELASRSRQFEDRIAELRTASTEAAELLQQGIAQAVDQLVNEPLMAYARQEAPRLRDALRHHADQLRGESPRELSGELERWIEQTIRAEFEQLVPRFERVIAGQLTESERRYAGRIERILEQVQDIASDVFGAHPRDALPDTGLRAPSRFSFKLTDAEHALDIIVGFGRTFAPGPLGRRLVLGDAEQRLIEMADRHAGRLRSELSARTFEAGKRYRRELAAAVDEAIDSIRRAIEHAREDRRHGERHARARIDQLARTAHRCEQLEATLNDWLAVSSESST
jgi:small GTP-binding protein